MRQKLNALEVGKLQCCWNVDLNLNAFLRSALKIPPSLKGGNVASDTNWSAVLLSRRFLKEDTYVDLRRFFLPNQYFALKKKRERQTWTKVAVSTFPAQVFCSPGGFTGVVRCLWGISLLAASPAGIFLQQCLPYLLFLFAAHAALFLRQPGQAEASLYGFYPFCQQDPQLRRLPLAGVFQSEKLIWPWQIAVSFCPSTPQSECYDPLALACCP